MLKITIDIAEHVLTLGRKCNLNNNGNAENVSLREKNIRK